MRVKNPQGGLHVNPAGTVVCGVSGEWVVDSEGVRHRWDSCGKRFLFVCQAFTIGADVKAVGQMEPFSESLLT